MATCFVFEKLRTRIKVGKSREEINIRPYNLHFLPSWAPYDINTFINGLLLLRTATSNGESPSLFILKRNIYVLSEIYKNERYAVDTSCIFDHSIFNQVTG